MAGFRVGVDIGGTFTDIILMNGKGQVSAKKLLSTPDDYSRAMLAGMADVCSDAGIQMRDLEQVVHGTTVVTNACIERTGAKVGLITTRGFRDVLEIGRGRLPVVLDLTWTKPPPLVPRSLRMEVDERVDGKGRVLRALDIESVEKALAHLLTNGIESLAVMLLNAPANPAHEREIARVVRAQAPDLDLSISSEVMPMFSEYERTSETVLNAYVMPLVAKYLRRLESKLVEAGVTAPLYLMQSSGGMTTLDNSVSRPIEIIECGPAAGVVGAAKLALGHGVDDLITFDMGGTTAKASIVERGRFTRAAEYEVGGGINRASRLLKGAGYVVRVASIDIAEIGAGGGSVLTIDAGGALRVGPQSAGAEPGPVAYNRGGVLPTVTDADVTLGYINPTHLCGGDYALDAEAARRALGLHIAEKLGASDLEAAYGAFQVANAQMMRAIRAVSSERGRDPRKFTLYAFGGAGPVHAAGVAAGLGMRTVIIPPVPGAFSAFGLLSGDLERHYNRSFSTAWNESALSPMRELLNAVEREAVDSMGVWAGSTAAAEKLTLSRFVDLQYAGQGSSLSIPVEEGELDSGTIERYRDGFEAEHERTYGHRLSGQPIRSTALRIVASIPSGIDATTSVFSGGESSGEVSSRPAYWGPKYGLLETPVYALADLSQTSSEIRAGPALVDCYDTTIVVPPGAHINSTGNGNVVMNLSPDNASEA
jgi:N-methylhydantoinase A